MSDNPTQQTSETPAAGPEFEPLTDINLVRFVTYGPNRGKSIILGGFEFTNGEHVTQRAYELAAAQILTRFYDVCAERDLPAKLKEYEAAQAEAARVARDAAKVKK